jgi:hypothetical protein
MMWTTARLTGYIAAGLGGLAFLLSSFGLASYDATTGMVDLHPFNVNWVAAIVAGPLASAIAAVAVMFKWGRNDKISGDH